MISVDAAWAAIEKTALAYRQNKAAENTASNIAVGDAVGRILAAPLAAKRTQPPRDMSAMDGYAVRFSDIESGIAAFDVIGEAPAGGAFTRPVEKSQAVRIFTGGVVPGGADHIIIQENVTRTGDAIALSDVKAEAQKGVRHIREAGQDFTLGDVLLPAGHRVALNDIGMIANANHAEIAVLPKPRIAFIASGDELVPPGQDMSDTQIPNSNSLALMALVESWGAQVVGDVLVKDDEALFTKAVKDLPPVDIIVPIGGASVGDYDYAKSVFTALDYQIIFEKIAVKPGKPCWFAKGAQNLVLGLPGNPSSAMVTAHLFLRPLIAHLSGADGALISGADALSWRHAAMAHDLAANGAREQFMRAQYYIDETGRVQVSTMHDQDSGMTRGFASASCLVQRKPDAAAAAKGDLVRILNL